jgi:hypothetical protein
MQALAWLAAVLLFFTLVYPAVGLELNQPGGGLLGYWNYSEFFRMHSVEQPYGWCGMTNQRIRSIGSPQPAVLTSTNSSTRSPRKSCSVFTASIPDR